MYFNFTLKLILRKTGSGVKPKSKILITRPKHLLIFRRFWISVEFVLGHFRV